MEHDLLHFTSLAHGYGMILNNEDMLLGMF